MTSCWIEKIPLEEFDDEKTELMTQLRATKWSSKIQFYRQVREPRDIQDLLKRVKGNHLIWMDDESFITLKKLPQSVPSRSKYRKAATNVTFEQKHTCLYGSSKDILARHIARLLCLKDEGANKVRLGNERLLGPLVPTTFITSQFLRNYMEVNPQRRLCLGFRCFMSVEESITLASHSEPLNVGIECNFEDQGRAFVETLAERTSDFGTLSVHRSYLNEYHTTDSSFHFPAEISSKVSQVELIMTSDILKTSQHALPLASPARRIEYKVTGYSSFDSSFDAIESLIVVPTAITVVFSYIFPARFHAQFLLSSGNVRELGLIYECTHSLSAAQRKDVLDAIKGNQNLYRLEFGLFNLDTMLAELLEMMGSHCSLRTVVFWVVRPSRYEPSQTELRQQQVESLVAFMKEHIHLDISFKCRDGCNIANNLDTIIKPVRLQNQARLLARESAHDRPAFFGAALTNWAAGDVSKTSVLLSENTDLLCSLIGQPLSLAPVDDPEQRVETRKRSAPSSPDAKKKLAKHEH